MLTDQRSIAGESPRGLFRRSADPEPELLPHPLTGREGLTALGAVAALVLLSILVVVAYGWGRADKTGADPLFWLGQVSMIALVSAMLISRMLPQTWRLAYLVVFAALQSFTTWAYNPDRFRFPDELQHLRTISDIERSGELFTPNPILPVSPGFPGLEIATDALLTMTGLDAYAAGVVVVSLWHALTPIAMYLLARSLLRSAEMSLLATLLLCAVPHSFMFNTLFVYGAPAIPLTIVTLWLYIRWQLRQGSVLWVVGAFGVVVLTHHLSAFVCLALLAATSVFFIGLRHTRPFHESTLALAAAAAVLLGWIQLAAPEVLAYLGEPLTRMAQSVAGVADLPQTQTEPSGTDTAGAIASPPLWQTLVTYAGVLLTLALCLVGAAVLWRRSGDTQMSKRWALWALGYPALLGLRVLAAGGSETAGRLMTYLYPPLCIVLAAGLWTIARSRPVLASVAASVLLISGLLIGIPAYEEKVPRPYLAESFHNTADGKQAQAIEWTAQRAPQHVRIVSDLGTSSQLTGSYQLDRVYRPQELWNLRVDDLQSRLAQWTAHYVVFDERLGREEEVFRADKLASPSAVKNTMKDAWGVQRVYDNGTMIIFDVRDVWGGREA